MIKLGIIGCGNIASFHIYDRALTAADVLQNYNAGKDTFEL